MVHFIRPEFAWLVLPWLLLFWWFVRKNRIASAWESECDAHLLPKILKTDGRKQTRFFEIAVMIFFLLNVVVLMGPSWHKKEVEVFQLPHASVLVVDLSMKMQTKDVSGQARMTWAQMKVREFTKRLSANLVGLVVFSDDAFVLSPMTEDSETIAHILPELSPAVMPVDGGNIVKAMNEAQKVLSNSNLSKGDILFFTSSTADAKAIKKASELNRKGFRVSVLGIGSREGAPYYGASESNYQEDEKGQPIIAKLDEVSLKKLAKAGGGVYQSVTLDNHDIDRLLDLDGLTAKEEKVKSENRVSIWRDDGRYGLVLAILIMLAFFSRRFIYRLGL